MPKQARKQRRVKSPIVAGLRGDSLLTIAQAVALIASRDRRQGDSDDSARDRSRKRLMYAFGAGYKVGGSPPRVEMLAFADTSKRLLRAGDLAGYLNARYPG